MAALDSLHCDDSKALSGGAVALRRARPGRGAGSGTGADDRLRPAAPGADTGGAGSACCPRWRRCATRTATTGTPRARRAWRKRRSQPASTRARRRYTAWATPAASCSCPGRAAAPTPSSTPGCWTPASGTPNGGRIRRSRARRCGRCSRRNSLTCQACRGRPFPSRPRRRFSGGPDRRQQFMPGIGSTARVGLRLDLRHQRRKPAGPRHWHARGRRPNSPFNRCAVLQQGKKGYYIFSLKTGP